MPPVHYVIARSTMQQGLKIRSIACYPTVWNVTNYCLGHDPRNDHLTQLNRSVRKFPRCFI